MDKSLLSLLSGAGRERTSLKDNPYLAIAASLAQSNQNTPPARNDLEAFLMPIVQGGMMGSVGGLSSEKEEENLFDYYKNNPLVRAMSANTNIGPVIDAEEYSKNLQGQGLAAYLSAEKPEGWTSQQGESDLLGALIGYQQQEEQRKAEQEIQAAVDKRAALLPVFQAEQQIRGAINPSGTNVKVDTGFSAAAADELRKSYAVVQEADTVADMLDKSDLGWGDYQLMRRVGAADKDGLGVAIKNLADRLTRARTGAALNKNEEALYSKMVGGDITVEPKQAAKLLRKLAASESRYLQSSMDFADIYKEGVPALRSQLMEQDAKRETSIVEDPNVVVGPDGKKYRFID
jgi:hypothetical protein